MTNQGANRRMWLAIRCAHNSNPTSRPIQKNLWLLHRFSRVGPDFKNENATCYRNGAKQIYICGILAENKLTSYHLPFRFPRHFIKKVLTTKNACAVLALYINRFAFRFNVADKSGRQIAACKLALKNICSIITFSFKEDETHVHQSVKFLITIFIIWSLI